MTIDLMMETQCKIGWSLADEEALEQLSEETKALVVRALMFRGCATIPRGAKTLEDAYREGWRDGVDACEVDRPWPPDQTPYSAAR